MRNKPCIVILGTFLRTQSNNVVSILTRCAPIQIRQAIVTKLAVLMTRFTGFGSWTDKSQQNRLMNINRDVTTIATRVYFQISRTARRFDGTPLTKQRRSITTAASTAPNFTMIGDSIAGSVWDMSNSVTGNNW